MPDSGYVFQVATTQTRIRPIRIRQAQYRVPPAANTTPCNAAIR